jgi:Ser/Thr protein kinase RdoA (MazF antagonist)
MQSHRTQVMAARRIAEAALERYAFPRGRLTFLTIGENATFRHDGAAGSHLVRVHRPQRHGTAIDPEAAIASELTWLQALRADTSLVVPDPIPASDGRLVISATASGRTRWCTVLAWLPGRIYEESARPVHFRRLGSAMAQLHAHADAWRPGPGFVRIDWDHNAFFGDAMVYGDLPAAECWDLLPPGLRSRFLAVADRMAQIMPTARDAGLIHADLHMGNVIFDGREAKLIDFDDCGTGARLYDVAVALWETRDRPRYSQCLDALLEGYSSIRTIDITHLDDYIAMRQIAFDLWYTGNAHINPTFAARLDNVHRWSTAMLNLVEG